MFKEQRTIADKFIEGELKVLIGELDSIVSSKVYPTADEQRGALNSAINKFFEVIRKTNVEQVSIKEFDSLNPVKQAELIEGFNQDIINTYNALADSQATVLSQANKFFGLIRSIRNKVRRASGVIDSTPVLNDIGVFETGDTFKNLARIDTQANLSQSQLNLVQETGVLTLPRSDATIIEPVIIDILDSSNGEIASDSSLAFLNDKNQDTWLEYTRISPDNSSEKLTLDLLIKFKLPRLINFIKLTPLTLDEKSFPRIEFIETSSDGRVYTSIRDSLPSFITKEEEEALFILGPYGLRNQYSSEFILTPRVTQFVKIRISQGKKIKNKDNLFEQSIRIRELLFQQIAYLQSGEIQTLPLPIPFNARKVLVEERLADTAPLTSVNYQVSLNKGVSFDDILPNVPLEINTGSQNSVEVLGETKEILLKILATRNSENFNGVAAPLASSTKDVEQLVNVNTLPTSLSLQEIPIQGSLDIFKPLLLIGSDNSHTLIANLAGQDNLIVDLPIKPEKFEETVRVGGHPWTRVKSFDSTGPDDTHYTIDYENSQIKFGDNVKGLVPEGEMTLQVEPEKITLPDISPYVVDLNYDHGFNKDTVLEWSSAPQRIKQEILLRGSTKTTLSKKDIVEYVEVTEEIPLGISSFFLKHVPLDLTSFEFTNTGKFTSGNYTATELVTGTMSPVKIELVAGTTSSTNAGFVTYKAVAKITNVQSTYNAEVWDTGDLQIYTPAFNDTSVFATKKAFINGSSELTQDGDYSISFKEGEVYCFTEVPQTGNVFVNYYHKVKKGLNWSFNSNSKQLVIEDDSALVNQNNFEPAIISQGSARYFIVFKDNRFIWIPFKQSYMENPDVEVFTGDLSSSDKPLQEPDPRVDFYFTPNIDFVLGEVLSSAKTKVLLGERSIVKNSIKFIFVGDDINSFDDRIVTTSTTGDITISPKPVKDVYGNSLTGSSFGITTQRDIDKTRLDREVAFIDGRSELKLGGDFSVDYKNGILYTLDPIPEHTIIQYGYSDISASYLAYDKLDSTDDYTLDTSSLFLTINSLPGVSSEISKDVLVKYNSILNFSQEPTTILNFYSPILYGYKLKVAEE